ncbi:MAG TPA: phosphate ABC transporter substrate-binding protein [Methanothrix sp.]|nr:phosphate ABC transporter substrate-binding protein [Methanothrix sp.]
MRKIAATLLMALLVGLIASASAAEKVTVSGSTTVLPLAEVEGEAFNGQQSDCQVTVTGGGTGAGITAAGEGRSDIAMASRTIKDSERSKYSKNNFQQFSIGYDGICIIVSKPIYDAGVKAITKDQLKDIYVGKITNWKDLKGPDAEIYAIAREEGSGTRDTFNELIMGSTTAETSGVKTVSMSSAEIKTAVVGSDKAIGYVGFSYAESGDVGILQYDGVNPNVANIKSGSYPLARHLYFYTWGQPTPCAQKFIDFVLSPDGQKIADENGFVPI